MTDPRPTDAPSPTPNAGPIPDQASASSGQAPTIPFNSAPSGEPVKREASTPAAGSPATAPHARLGMMGPYELVEELDRGGMGVVYRARHQGMDRFVALKTLLPKLSGDREAATRFQREVRAAAGLSHRHIVTIYEVGEHGGRPYYAMTYLDGGSLSGHRERLRDDPRAAVALVEKIARAVHYAHERGVFHRDLKPGNVLFNADGEPIVTDFGLAKLRDGDVELTQTGAVLGTPAYMAPEQASGRARHVGPATDVWALGVILYELLTGQRPFAGSSKAEVMHKVRAEAPLPLRTHRPDLSAALEAVVTRCLQKSRKRRYATAGSLADDLARCLRGEDVLVPPPPCYRRAYAKARQAPLLRLLAVLSVGAIIALAAIGLSSPASAPPRAHQPPRKDLIGPSGPPAHWRWLVGEKEADLVPIKPGDAFTIKSAELGLLELLETCPWDRYWLEAQVQPGNGKDVGEMGLYFAYDRFASRRGLYHSFWKLALQDERRGEPFMLAVARYRDARSHHYVDQSPPNAVAPGEMRPQGSGEHDWPRIAVEVTAFGLRCFRDEVCIVEARMADVEELSLRVLNGIEDVCGPFTPKSSLGVFVYRCTASFRNVSIRPLP